MSKSIIYQMLPRLWGNQTSSLKKGGELSENGSGHFSGIDSATFDYLKSLGVTHVWYTGIVRHATATSTGGCTPSSAQWVKGKAGSPYSITDYFDVNPYLADDPSKRMEEFEDLVKRTHAAGLKVIMDFVPNHVARDYGAFSPGPIKDGRDANGHPVFGALDETSVHWRPENDFFYYPDQELELPVAPPEGTPEYKEYPAKASGNCYTPQPTVNDWYDTIKLNYCDYRTGTWDKMLEVIQFWASKGVDGFRCDMVELVPKEFCRWLISKTKRRFPNVIFIAEVYEKHLYDQYVHEVGFDYLYDKSGLYDALHDILVNNASDIPVPVEEWQSTLRITWNWQFLGGLQPYMLNFLENHDEQRLCSPMFAGEADKTYAGMYVAALMNTAPLMIYAGQEVGERGMDAEGFSGKDGRTTIFDWWSPASLARLYKEIHGEKALQERERAILNKYREILTFASTSPAIGEGLTYDLCYCNYGSEGFDRERHYAFLRRTTDDTLLIVANFSAKDAEMQICIPAHAFQWLGIKQTLSLNTSTLIDVKVPAHDGTIIPL
ncbi:MAG: alpha-amylase [Bacteroidales bacterium]|nr:alpha-amylase [Bacteroidales bacterium]